ncbi:Hint domain-containing protein [Planktotalea sp.]|uniref:Hint domain-containing protein n=1 Tax=Planktotalea sp. TaxID=2029877 RepID=UPI003F6D2124
MPVTIPVGGGTFTAVEGETYILSPNTTGDIIFNGDAAFNVVIDTDQTGGSDNQFDLNLLSGTDPTVTYAAGVDASSHQINASGDSLTINVGAGATVADFDAKSVSGPSGFVLDLGDNVTVNGDVEGPLGVGAGSDYTIGSGVAIIGALRTAGREDASITAGDDLTVNGALGTLSAFAETSTQTVTLGNNATVTGGVNFLGAESVTFEAGDDFSVSKSGTFAGSGGDDQVIFGDRWFVDGNVNAGAGNDQLYLGIQGNTTDSTTISGGGGNDGITVTPANSLFRSDANSAGWRLNPDGTVSSQPFSSNLFSAGNTNHNYTSFEADGPTAPICFTAGTKIEVAHGETVNVEDLAQGDMVMTADHGLQPVRWIGTKTIAAAHLAAQGNLRPIRISAGALGDDLPERDLLVSPQHRMLVRSWIAQRMFDENEVLVAAKHLLALDGIDVADDVHEVTYVHFLCDTHEVVFANGALSESRR